MSATIMGGCLCAKIRFAFNGTVGAASYCHCSDCRKCTGSAFNVSVAVEKKHFEIITGCPQGFTMKAASGHELTRHFCAGCGSPLFTSSPRHADVFHVKAGAFDNPAWVQPAYQSWTRSAVPWATIDIGLRSYETSRS